MINFEYVISGMTMGMSDMYNKVEVLEPYADTFNEKVTHIDNKYSKTFLNKIINYCKVNNVKLSVSSWDEEVYHYLQSQDHVTMLGQFPELSLFTERADDGRHPHRKHYQYFVNEIVKTL